MTTFGKLLVFANLVFGVGAATWAAAVYTQRPAWYDPAPDGGTAKGTAPATFAGLGAELDTLGKAAAAAGAAWSGEAARLAQDERVRVARQVKMFGGEADGKRVRGLLDVARTGGLPGLAGKDKNADAAFFNLKADPATGLYNLDPNPAEKGVVVQGPDGLPLRGADTLLERFNVDAKAVADAAAKMTELRAKQIELGDQVGRLERQVLKQQEIREDLRVQAAYLAGFEVNAVGELDWARTRKTQLVRRLSAFGKRGD